jgi:diguanylate cyclase (GGDEF)-like protein/PAS domain S-box-containing protein
MNSYIQNRIIKVSSLFFLFSLFVIISFIFIHHYFFSHQIKETAIDNGIKKTKEREFYVKNFLKNSKQLIISINQSKALKNYIEYNRGYQNLKNLFETVATSNEYIMQIRLIDKDGKERIRIDRDEIGADIYEIKKSSLQDKSDRYYYQKALGMPLDSVWFSQIDLNIENREVEIPFKPTFRAIMPIKDGDSFGGIIVINYFLEEFLNGLLYTPLYDIILLNNKGHILRHYQKDKSWGEYRDKKIDIYNIYPNFATDILTKDLFISSDFVSRKFSTDIQNGLIMVLKLNKQYLEKEHKNEVKLYTYVSLIIILLSFFISIIITSKYKDVLFSLHKIKEYSNLIDKNIITSSTDLDGNITDVSDAFCKVSEYSKEELIGQNHRIIKDKSTPQIVYKKMWDIILKNEVWEGELKNISKSGNIFWIHMYIYPIFENKKKIGYTAIRHDITDKKRLEELTNKDGLTNIYNRRYFNEYFTNITKNIKDKYICFMMIDIDNFKQYNDTYGHLEGDNVIISVAKYISEYSDKKHFNAFRLGGEEFGVVYISEDTDSANKIAQEIKEGIENLKIVHEKNSASKYVTISAGLVCKKPKSDECYKRIYKECDEYLYKAKDSGKNRVVTS